MSHCLLVCLLALLRPEPLDLNRSIEFIVNAQQPDVAIDADALLGAYHEIVTAWIGNATTSPAEIDLFEVIADVHSARAAHQIDSHRFAALDWQEHSYELARGGRFQDLIRFVQRVTPTYGADTPYASLLWVDLAGICYQLGRSDDAADALDRSASVLDHLEGTEDPRFKDPLTRARCLHSGSVAMASIKRGLADLAYPAVEECFEEGARHLRESGDGSLYLDGLLVRVAHAMALDRFEDVIAYLEDPTARSVMSRPESAIQARKLSLRLAISQVFLERWDPTRPRVAEEALRELTPSLEANGDLVDRRLLKVWVAIDALGGGRIDVARSAIKAAASLIDPNGEDFDPHVATVQALRVRLIRAESTDRDRTLEEVERTAGVLDAMLSQWRQRGVLETGEGYLLFDELRDLVSEYVDLLVESHGDVVGGTEAWRELSGVHAIGSLARSLGVGEERSFDEARATFCGRRRGCLLILPGWNGSRALLLGDTDAGVVPLPPSFLLERERRTLVAAVTSVVLGEKRFDAEELERRRTSARDAFLPERVRSRIDEWDELVIVATDGSGYLPFELLPWGEDSTVGERFAVSYIPSLPVGLALARRDRDRVVPPANRVTIDVGVGFGDRVDGGIGFGETERELLLAHLPTSQIRLTTKIGRPWWEDRNRSVDNWLQVIAHGARIPRSARPYGLQLADAPLSPGEVEELEVPSTVLVTACETWRGPMRRGDDGRHHLAGALFLAGAQRLLISHTPIDFHDSLRITNGFYRAALTGASAAESLRAARVELRATNAGLLPLSASLIHVVGLGASPMTKHATDQPSPRRREWLQPGLMALLLGACALLYRRSATR